MGELTLSRALQLRSGREVMSLIDSEENPVLISRVRYTLNGDPREVYMKLPHGRGKGLLVDCMLPIKDDRGETVEVSHKYFDLPAWAISG